MAIDALELTDYSTANIVLLFEICQLASIVLAAFTLLLLPYCASLVTAFVVHRTCASAWNHGIYSFLAPRKRLVHIRRNLKFCYPYDSPLSTKRQSV